MKSKRWRKSDGSSLTTTRLKLRRCTVSFPRKNINSFLPPMRHVSGKRFCSLEKISNSRGPSHLRIPVYIPSLESPAKALEFRLRRIFVTQRRLQELQRTKYVPIWHQSSGNGSVDWTADWLFCHCFWVAGTGNFAKRRLAWIRLNVQVDRQTDVNYDSK